MLRLIAREEHELRARFGTQWDEYCVLTPSVLIPRSWDQLITSMIRHKSSAEWLAGFRANAIKIVPFTAILIGWLWFPTRLYVSLMIAIFVTVDAAETWFVYGRAGDPFANAAKGK
jgi:protein-S-isoprenylcysteine O-methyltransferase Ste14